jgi:hypothetical protein
VLGYGESSECFQSALGCRTPAKKAFEDYLNGQAEGLVGLIQRLRFVKAQLGRKPGGGDLLRRLLSDDDLPGETWGMVDERTWRTGVTASTPWGDRAREAGSVSAWRSFLDQAKRREVWLEVMPLASAADARTALRGIGDLTLRNLRATVRVVDESDIDIEPFVGASAVWAHEYHTVGPGGHAASLMLAGAVENFVVIVCASGQPGWDWPSVSDLAALQAPRLTKEAIR